MTSFPANFELKFEITESCNSRCNFCHQEYGTRKSHQHLSVSAIQRRISWAAEHGIGTVRFTGGEPLLHPGLGVVTRFAQELGRYVIINSNGLAPAGKYEDLGSSVDMFKISLPAADESTVDQITGVPGAFRKKICAIGQCLATGAEVQILTVVLRENIGRLESFVRLCDNVPGLSWSPLRAEMTLSGRRPVLREDMQALAEELSLLMDRYPASVHKLGLATPFCAVDPIELGERVFMGRGEDCGPFCSLTVTSDDELVSCYSCRTQISRSLDRADIEQDLEYKRLTGVQRLPQQCRDCPYVGRCMGGCSAPEATVQLDAGEIDYLAIR